MFVISDLDNIDTYFSTNDAPSLVYSKTDVQVWKTLFTKLKTVLNENEEFIHPEYLYGINKLNFSAHEIPSIEFINEQLSSTGWQVASVAGFVPAHVYPLMLKRKIFPVSRKVRSLSHLQHSAAPDFAHDILGHLPMLLSSEYSECLTKWAIMTTKSSSKLIDDHITEVNAKLIELKSCINQNKKEIDITTKELLDLHKKSNKNPSALRKLTRFYVWSIEYGLLKFDKSMQLFGSAILSSSGEISNILNGAVKFQPFNNEIFNIDVDYTVLQDTLYAAKDFSEYLNCLQSL